MTTLVTSYGSIIQKEGLAGIGIESCGHVLCAGDLDFGLAENGLYFCKWQCPKDHSPAETGSLLLTGPNCVEMTTGLTTGFNWLK